jgi:hypothetical protein
VDKLKGGKNMTVCKLLAEKGKDGKTISAWENLDKYSRVPYYEITVSRDSIAYQVIKTARTTWKKKFKEVCDEEGVNI